MGAAEGVDLLLYQSVKCGATSLHPAVQRRRDPLWKRKERCDNGKELSPPRVRTPGNSDGSLRPLHFRKIMPSLLPRGERCHDASGDADHL